MYQRRRARVLLAVLVLVTLVLITVDFRSDDDGPVGALRSAATSLFGPIQDGLAAMLRPIGGAASSVTDLFRLRDENVALRGRLAELEERRSSYEDLQRSNDELRALLELQQRSAFETVASEVIAWSSSNYEFTVTIDAGEREGVALGMPVINQDGLVGRIVQVTPSASRVLLAVDPNFSAAVRTTRERENGRLSGDGPDPLRFELLDPEADVRPGDEVVTSAYSNGVFPAGIPVGTVEDVGEATTLLSLEVTVRPFVDFTALGTVLVVLHEPVADLPPITTDPNPRIVPPVIPSPSPDPRPGASPAPGASPEPTGSEARDGTTT